MPKNILTTLSDVYKEPPLEHGGTNAILVFEKRVNFQ
jgi:hypothetical protein